MGLTYGTASRIFKSLKTKPFAKIILLQSVWLIYFCICKEKEKSGAISFMQRCKSLPHKML